MTRRSITKANFLNKYRILGCLLVCVSFVLFLFSASPAEAADAALYMAPSNGTFVIGETFSVGVNVNTDGAAINAAEGTISFDNSVLEVVNVSSGGSVFSLWTEGPDSSNSAGTIFFGGGVPSGYTGGAGRVCTITFKSKKAGKGTARFTSGAVLANDGKGTNILASMESATYTISPEVNAPEDEGQSRPEPSTSPAREEEEEAAPEPDYNKPAIESSTHPDPEKWYNKNKVKFSWEMPDDITGVSIAFDQDPYTDPGPVSDGEFAQKEYTADTDGAWYLHLKLKDASRWGTIARRKVLIDTTSPQPFDINVKPAEPGDWPTLTFETKDDPSGLDIYELFIGSLEKQSHKISSDQTEFKPINLGVGDHTVLIKAKDKAGNERVASTEFTVEPIEAPVIEQYPQELKSGDHLYLSGTAIPGSEVTLYISQADDLVATSSVKSEASGNWFYIHKGSLEEDRYVAWATAKNSNGISSLPSEKRTFLVSPPVFAQIGSFVINYFTVFVSLLFLIILIIIAVFFLASMIRKRLRKEAGEVEEVVSRNLEEYKQTFDQEFSRLARYEGAEEYKDEKAKSKAKLKKKIDTIEKKIMKEVKDIEDILE